MVPLAGPFVVETDHTPGEEYVHLSIISTDSKELNWTRSVQLRKIG